MNTVGAVAFLAIVACATAGLLGPPVYGPAFVAPVVKTVHHPVYAVHPPILAKPVVYAPPPVVKVLHAPVVKHVSYGPVAYGAYGAYGPVFF